MTNFEMAYWLWPLESGSIRLQVGWRRRSLLLAASECGLPPAIPLYWLTLIISDYIPATVSAKKTI